ncbi:MAG: selenocysteine-specific translation elongation factor, partial [Proteobacteria bacterium]|nr:selenocysteine-specific translation elongation factor [Pseudomonadota bacterium]
MIIATAGHIDHGKSLLVKALTGVETDRLPEEKKRGMSIDLGFAYQPLPSGEVLGFVDVPGHERFIRNMLAGVTGIDFAMLIIAADDGPMPQTIEHLAILNLLGVDQGVIALTKIDRVDEARRDDVTLQIQELIADTSLSEAEIMPVSAITGEGVEDLRAYLELMAESIRQRSQDGNFRLAIDRCFTLPGAGMVVTGSVFAGSVRVGDQLVLSPQGIQARVRSIHAQNREAESGTVGERCALNLAGTDVRRNDIHRGGWLLDGVIHNPVPRFDARLHVLPGEPRSLKHWTPVHVHLGAAEVPGRVALLEGKSIAPGESGLVQIVLDRRIGALRGDGFIIRDQSAQRTMAGGRVLDPFSPARGRARPERIAVLGAMEAGSPEVALSALLKQQPGGVELSPFGTAWNLTPDAQSSLWQSVEMKTVGGEGALVGFAVEYWDELGTKILAAIKHSH